MADGLFSWGRERHFDPHRDAPVLRPTFLSVQSLDTVVMARYCRSKPANWVVQVCGRSEPSGVVFEPVARDASLPAILSQAAICS
jgi:hypothetical protein